MISRVTASGGFVIFPPLISSVAHEDVVKLMLKQRGRIRVTCRVPAHAWNETEASETEIIKGFGEIRHRAKQYFAVNPKTMYPDGYK